MSLPIVKIAYYDRGWSTTCTACTWRMWRPDREPIELAAQAHYRSHALGAAR